MARQVVLHVGAMKSGTTYLQDLLFVNKQALSEQGVLVAGATHGDQARAVDDLRGQRSTEATRGAWGRLVHEIDAHPGTAVVSVELLAPARPEVVDEVGKAFGDCTVVVTARDLNRSLASMWQETVQNGRSWHFDEYVEGARCARPRPERRPEDVNAAGRTFWRQQNIVRLCRNWGRVAPVKLVTVPPPTSPASLLPERFLSILGVPAANLAPPPQANARIGAASAMVLRRMNALLSAQGLDYPARAAVRKAFLAKRVMAERAASEPHIGLSVAPWTREHAAVMVTRLKELDVELVGEWSDLDPVAVPGVDPRAIPSDEVIEAAVVALAALVTRG